MALIYLVGKFSFKVVSGIPVQCSRDERASNLRSAPAYTPERRSVNL
jgi:hypothetical protein